jgi:hypothetical protein
MLRAAVRPALCCALPTDTSDRKERTALTEQIPPPGVHRGRGSLVTHGRHRRSPRRAARALLATAVIATAALALSRAGDGQAGLAAAARRGAPVGGGGHGRRRPRGSRIVLHAQLHRDPARELLADDGQAEEGHRPVRRGPSCAADDERGHRLPGPDEDVLLRLPGSARARRLRCRDLHTATFTQLWDSAQMNAYRAAHAREVLPSEFQTRPRRSVSLPGYMMESPVLWME